jgi:hypothetical protein
MRLVKTAIATERNTMHKKMRFSVTDAACIGAIAIDSASVVRPDEVLNLVAVPVPPELNILHLQQTWPACTAENEVQVTGCVCDITIC